MAFPENETTHTMAIGGLTASAIIGGIGILKRNK